jgi:TolB protein
MGLLGAGVGGAVIGDRVAQAVCDDSEDPWGCFLPYGGLEWAAGFLIGLLVGLAIELAIAWLLLRRRGPGVREGTVGPGGRLRRWALLVGSLLLALLVVASVAGCGGGKLEVIDPVVSPDGRAIAFVGYRGGSILGRNSGDLYVLGLRGKPRRLTRTPSDQDEPRQPAWSSDGLRLAFSRDSYPGPGSVWVVNVDGTRLRKVADGSDPTWAPGDKLLVFRNDSLGIGAVKIDGSGDPEIVRHDYYSYEPVWSPDGLRIAYTTPRGLVVLDLRTKQPLTLPSTRGSLAPAWSPDGRRLAYVASPSDAVSDGFHDSENQELYVIDADGNGRLRLTNNDIGESSPSWTPDRRIVFERSQQIYVMSTDGENARRLYGKSGRVPSWTPFAIALFALGGLVGIAGYTYEKFRKAPSSPSATA